MSSSAPNPTGAVFLSYAREDGDVVRDIADALQSAGVEVWFDQSELRGGDAWDQKIRKQIKECAFFVPVISANTQARREGYFRIEWKLAAQRTHAMADGTPFLLPVVIDDTPESRALVPAEFREVQWSRIHDQHAASVFARRLHSLVGPGAVSTSPFISTQRGAVDSPPSSSQMMPRDNRAARYAALAALVAIVLGVALWRSWKSSEPPPRPVEKTPVASAPSLPANRVEPKTIAVLAFDNLSDDKTNDSFSDGISEELINALGRVAGLTVKGRTSSFFFKGRNVSSAEIAQKLDVAYLVRGGVRKSDNKVRITAQLSRAATDELIWSSEPLERPLENAWAVQEEFAGLIAKNLQLKLTDAPRAPKTINPEAHRLVLEARFFWAQRSEEAFAKGEQAARQALKIDEQFAPAHAALADVYTLRGWWRCLNAALPATEDFSRGRDEAELARQLDPTLFEPLATLGAVAFNLHQFEAAEDYFQKAFALNPNYAVAHFWRATLLIASGRLEDAFREYETADRLDPLSFSMVDSYARHLCSVGRHEESLRMYDRAMALRPNVPFTKAGKAILLLELGRRAEAVELARTVARDEAAENRRWSDAGVAFVLKQAGLADELRSHTARALSRLPADGYVRGLLLAVLGEMEQARPFLERTPPPMFGSIYLAPEFEDCRKDPRLAPILQTLGCAKEFELARASLARMRKGTPTPK